MNAVKRIYGYLKTTLATGPAYSPDTKEDSHDLEMYVDADWAGCPDTRKSTTGWVVLLAGGPISWSSKRQSVNALSSCEAEYVAATAIAQEATWLRNFINELKIPGMYIDKVLLHVDNEAAIAVAKNPEFHNRMKHIENKHHYLRQCVQEGIIDIRWVRSKQNMADMLTKALPKDLFEKLREKIGMEAVVTMPLSNTMTAVSGSVVNDCFDPVRQGKQGK